ncbi:fibronectin type III domain-containing protein [Chryseobacterium sp. PBS4-4]|uniref:Fibronectin type III domain-containing protein n=1 Tax=Chryseobacterium edaphi TaxID=2976532 RepID=A0ABT2W360_9FLAO|nr:fibronectin type III domain-containing protein [Chryseobacterium edaphi]MCU7615677.1 fibronectin type III domain-containing protein [Chryseobacterium edaphi]
MGLTTSYSKTETDVKLQRLQMLFGSGLHEKPLKISDPVPTQIGGYILAEIGDYAFGTTEVNKWNVGFLSSGGWEIISVEISATNNSNNSEFTEFNNLWSGNNFLNLNANRSLNIDKTKKQGYLIVKQDSTGNKTLTVESTLLDINLLANQKTLIGYILIGTELMFSINKNLIETTVAIPDSQNPSPATLTTENITHNSVNLIMTGATDNVGVVGFDIYKDNVFLVSTNLNNYKVTGLALNTNYSFKVKSKDAAGNVSVFSNIVSATTLAQAVPTSLTFSVHDGSFTTLSDGVHRITNQNEVGVSDQTLTGDGYFEFGGNVIGSMMFGLDDVSTLRSYGNPLVWNCHVIVGNSLGDNYVNYRNGSQSQQGSPSGILKYRLSRTGTQVKLLKSTDGTNFTDLYNYPNAISGELWLKLSNPVGGTATTEYVKLLNL